MAIKLRQPPAAAEQAPARPRVPRVSPYQWAALALITLGAAALRLLYIGKVSPDPFYDAAVRSMSLSWHNFFFGAFEPGGSVSIDKPPIDLWFQVASVKLLGFSSTTLKLPEVFAGIASVPLLFAVVRRIWGPAAGLAAALALAVLPVDVITSRSDTMDVVMMALILLSLLFLIHAAETGRTRWLLGAAATLGVAFDVKLLESLIAVPALAVFAYLGLPGARPQRFARLAAAAGVYVLVALSWLTATQLAPAHERPFAIGSSNGSAWNAAFVFNGTERLGGKSPEPQFTVYEPGHHYPTATQSERDHIPIVPASPTRLLARIGPLSGERLGLELLAALLLGVPALLWSVRRPVRESPPGAVEEDEERPSGVQLRLLRAGAAALIVWMLAGIVLFSAMARLHPRYVEAFTPAVAAMLGIGAAWAVVPRGRARLAVLLGTLAVTVIYAERLLYGATGAWWVALLAGLGATVFALLARVRSLDHDLRSVRSTATLVMTLACVLAIPLSADITAIDNHVTDAGYVGALPSEEQRLLSDYLRAHQGSARYEVASVSATGIGSLIVQDARPVLVLTSYGSRVFTSVPKLQRLIAEGQVRYAFLNASCGRHGSALNPGCSAPAKWVRAHGTDVSAAAGLPHAGLLWLLPGAKP
ncbi:MAG TPA: glycosyltransferase family 39 protein [Solirubrobacteraceae bacterium]|jgi:4-amino-4-deoxy-L-arabinose transferase-like glycosyltransferase|nr:glycosyltransferase family 39 protein [Solirubrobacteraceae bacterium]